MRIVMQTLPEHVMDDRVFYSGSEVHLIENKPGSYNFIKFTGLFGVH